MKNKEKKAKNDKILIAFKKILLANKTALTDKIEKSIKKTIKKIVKKAFKKNSSTINKKAKTLATTTAKTENNKKTGK